MTDITAGQYLSGVIGSALLRQWYHDGATNADRMAELGDLLGRLDEFPFSMALNPAERDLATGYSEWAESYDGVNPLIAAEQPVVRPILEQLAVADAHVLDAACGTGRHAAFLAGLGCNVIGLDQSEAMLEVARSNVPDARFESGDVEAMPFDDACFDLTIVALALCHLADPTAAVSELARVLAPGGALVITEPHPMSALIGGQAFYGGIVPGQDMTWVRNHYHSTSTWLNAFAGAALTVEQCIEVPMTEEQIATSPAATIYPEATRAATEGLLSFWVWVVRGGDD